MTGTVGATTRVRGWFPALVASAGVLLFVLARTALDVALTALEMAVYPGSSASPWTGWWWNLGYTELAFCLGLFLALWLLAPIGAQLRLAHVVTRVLLDVLAATVLALVVAFFLGPDWGRVGLVDLGATGVSFGLRALAQLVAAAAHAAIDTATQLLPAALLAGVLLWLWSRSRPARRDAPGLVDRV